MQSLLRWVMAPPIFALLAILGPRSSQWSQPSESLWPTDRFRWALWALVDLLAPCSWTIYLEYSHPCRSACPWENCCKVKSIHTMLKVDGGIFTCLGSSLPLHKHLLECCAMYVDHGINPKIMLTSACNLHHLHHLNRYTSSPLTSSQAISQIDCLIIHFQIENNPEKCNKKPDAKCFTVFQTMSGFKYRSEKSTTPIDHTSLDGMYILTGSKVKTSGEK